jgi:zinc protease
MRKIYKSLICLFAAAVALLPQSVQAQMPQLPPIPVDSAVRIGHLDNGITYYIRHNEYPKGQAEFYIAQKVGSIQEEDSQRGLAHFLEHMCFNGTKHFPGNELISWLESVGVKFGQNLNAYTSVDRTVYNMSNVPVAREGVQDSCLLILRDWANDLLLSPEEIDKERGVIHEEWRRSNVGQMRILNQLLPTIYPDSKYAYRLPIGTMEVVDNFEPQTLRSYYEKWYRPDLQGILVVGDINPDRIEAKIKEMFSTITMPENPAKFETYPVPDHQGTIYAIGKDKEMPYSIVELVFKHDPTPDAEKVSMAYLMEDYAIDMIESMLSTRLNDLTSKSDCPASMANAEYGKFMISKTKEAFTLVSLPKDNSLDAIATVYREGLRAVRGGFTASEYDRARSEYLSTLEKAYTNRATTTSNSLVREYVENFIDNEPIPGIENEFTIMSMLANQIPVEAINQMMSELMPADNRILIAMYPDKEGVEIPTEEQFAAALAAVDAEQIEGYVDNVINEPLIAKLPKKGKIVGTSTDKVYGATVWTLSNGAKVVAKPTDFKAGEILFKAGASGSATAAFPDSYNNEIRLLPYTTRMMGMGPYDNASLSKYLAGKQASVSVNLGGNFTRDMSGSAVPKDLTTMMEMIYSWFTAPTLSAEEFESNKNAMRAMLHNQEANPEYQFSKKLTKYLYESPRSYALDIDVVDGADRQRSLEIVKKAFENAGEYTFYFVGSFDLDTLKPLVEQYIASLPGKAVKKNAKYPEVASTELIRKGSGTEKEQMTMDTPTTYTSIMLYGDMPVNAKNKTLASVAGQILSARLLKLVREDLGAVYSIWAVGRQTRVSEDKGSSNAMITSSFPMKPEMRDQVLAIIAGQIEDMQNAANITDEELGKVKEFMLKNAEEALKKNDSLISAMRAYQEAPFDAYLNAAELAASVTAADVADFMTRLAAQGNYRVFLLEPQAE